MEQTSQICTSHVERWRPVKELKECSIEFCKLKMEPHNENYESNLKILIQKNVRKVHG